MEEKDLLKGWALLQPKRLMSAQMSVRLPVDVWVRIIALCNMFPGRTRTQIIGDLLSSALERVPEGLSNEPDPGEKEASPGPFYGQRGRYEYLVDFYMKEFVKDGKWIFDDERRTRVSKKRDATPHPTTPGRPAEGPRGDRPDRKRGGRRRPPE
jgi:hypothetical protein